MTQEEINAFSYRIPQASRTELIVIMLEMGQNYIRDAYNAHESNDTEAFRGYIKQAKRVTDALSSSLDMRYSVSAELLSIYLYASRVLGRALAGNEAGELDTLRKVFKKLRDTFAKLARDDSSGPVMSNTQTVYAGLTYSNGRLNEIACDIHGGAGRGYTV